MARRRLALAQLPQFEAIFDFFRRLAGRKYVICQGPGLEKAV